MQAEKKPLYASLAAAALVLIVGFAVIGRWQSVSRGPAGGPAPSATSTDSAGLAVEVVTRASSTDQQKVSIEYPRFPSSPELTRRVESFVDETEREFAKTVAADAEARGETGASPVQYALYVTWEHAQLNREYASFILHVYAFEGGAHGRDELRSFNWNLETGRPVALLDLFPRGSLQGIADYARNVLGSMLGENTSAEFLDSGTAPNEDNYQWYTFTDDAVTVYFPRYQVAPGAAGEQKVTIPRNQAGIF